jgi:hypothetical protein
MEAMKVPNFLTSVLERLKGRKYNAILNELKLIDTKLAPGLKNVPKADELLGQARSRVISTDHKSMGDLALGAVVVGGGALTGWGTEKVEKFLHNRKLHKYFLEMLAEVPELNKNKIEALKYFSSLWELNPDIAKNPRVAGTFVKQHMEMDVGIPYQAALDLIKVRDLAKSKDKKSLLMKDMLQK